MTALNFFVFQTLLDLRDKFNYMLVYSFKNNDVFKNKINDEFKYFFNINSKLPEYLALFICEKFKVKTLFIMVVIT